MRVVGLVALAARANDHAMCAGFDGTQPMLARFDTSDMKRWADPRCDP